jgi:lipopolysaccharide export system protein LptA
VKLEEKLKLKSGKNQTRRAFAEKLEGHQRTGKIILTGAPRVEQGNDIIKGYQITLRENVELVEVDDSQSSFSLKKDKK